MISAPGGRIAEDMSDASAREGVSAGEWSDATASEGGGESLVQQHLRDEVDINSIMKRFSATGEMPFGRQAGFYGDFSDVIDFESAVEKVDAARQKFLSLPPEVRERFGNDPGVMIAKARELGREAFIAELSGSEFNPKPVVVEKPGEGAGQ